MSDAEERARQARARSAAFDLAEVAAGLRDFDDAAISDDEDEQATTALIVAQARLTSLLAEALARRLKGKSRVDVLQMFRVEYEASAARGELDATDRDGIPSMREDITVTPGGDVLLSGLAVRNVATALELVGAAHRRNGGGSSALVAPLFEAFVLAVSRQRGFAVETAKPLLEVDVAASAMADPITSEEAARLLDRTPQNVTKHCRRGAFETVRKVGGQWVIERADVLARIERIAS